jgi:membrane-associated phospholipid phosphatase
MSVILKSVFLLFVIFVLIASGAYCQKIERDSVLAGSFSLKTLIIPGVLLGYGIIGVRSDGLEMMNKEVQEEVHEHIDEHVTIDDFLQYFSIAATLGLDQTGLESAHGYKGRAIILTASYILLGVTVNALKYSVKEQRPDGSTFNSFPSGHTATAFMGAEFLMQEYKNSSLWPGIIGYTVAAGTGMYRVLNDRHWVTDVAAGAGIGILSTKVAYWVYPFLNRAFSGKHKKVKSFTYTVAPYMTERQKGIVLSLQF